MMKTRYLKGIRDLTKGFSKNLMLILAIAVGAFGIGTILGGYSVIKREMADNYMGSVPASATLELEDSISAPLLEKIRKLDGIKVAERHATISARMKVEDKWHSLLLFVIDDFRDKQTNKVAGMSGATVPPVGTMLVERSALPVMKIGEGEEILIKTPSGEPKSIAISGVVHDPSLAPAWQEGGGYGYITLPTLHWLGENQGFDQLRVLVSEYRESPQHITEKATEVANWLEQNGFHIHEIQVPPPGRHPHQSQMNAVMSIFVVFTFMVLILGSVLVAASMATLMVKQVRQIGIMKTIGAQSSQVAWLYLLMILVICIIALAVAVPLSRLAAAGFYTQIASLLNLEIRNDTFPFWVILVQVASGILIPLIAAAVPVVKGSRISIRQAMDNYGVSRSETKTGLLILKLSQFTFFGEILLLSIRNVFRQRSRLILTLSLLAAGGAMFMTALNVSEAWEENLDRIYTQRLYDLEVRLNGTLPMYSIETAIRDFSGINHAEGWFQTSTSLFTNDSYEVTHTYPDKGHGSFVLQALPLPTNLLNPTMVAGDWLSEGDANGVVLNQLARELIPGLAVGDEILLSLDGNSTRWKVIGFAEDVGAPATAYVSLNALSKYRIANTINTLRIGYSDRSEENAMRKNRELESHLSDQNISIKAAVPVWLLHNTIAAHMEVLVNSLMAMAMLMAFVGTLGLMSTMSMNVMERTREIGVIRAIGATPGKIRSLVVWEGFIVGLLSILLAFVLAVMLSAWFGGFLGNMAFRTPLSLMLSVPGIGIWVLIIFIGSLVATLFPARRANRISTREALSYE